MPTTRSHTGTSTKRSPRSARSSSHKRSKSARHSRHNENTSSHASNIPSSSSSSSPLPDRQNNSITPFPFGSSAGTNFGAMSPHNNKVEGCMSSVSMKVFGQSPTPPSCKSPTSPPSKTSGDNTNEATPKQKTTNRKRRASSVSEVANDVDAPPPDVNEGEESEGAVVTLLSFTAQEVVSEMYKATFTYYSAIAAFHNERERLAILLRLKKKKPQYGLVFGPFSIEYNHTKQNLAMLAKMVKAPVSKDGEWVLEFATTVENVLAMYSEVAKNYYQILELLGRSPAKGVDLGSMKDVNLSAVYIRLVQRPIHLMNLMGNLRRALKGEDHPWYANVDAACTKMAAVVAEVDLMQHRSAEEEHSQAAALLKEIKAYLSKKDKRIVDNLRKEGRLCKSIVKVFGIAARDPSDPSRASFKEVDLTYQCLILKDSVMFFTRVSATEWKHTYTYPYVETYFKMIEGANEGSPNCMLMTREETLLVLLLPELADAVHRWKMLTLKDDPAAWKYNLIEAAATACTTDNSEVVSVWMIPENFEPKQPISTAEVSHPGEETGSAQGPGSESTESKPSTPRRGVRTPLMLGNMARGARSFSKMVTTPLKHRRPRPPTGKQCSFSELPPSPSSPMDSPSMSSSSSSSSSSSLSSSASSWLAAPSSSSSSSKPNGSKRRRTNSNQ
eukprot:TRINITY_DN5202_c0_g3_i1.p1 TRINITY_DN5202_c0_g3~~TRINITY_DN5202_c0_g3_i1.p1  ORF type:complete len:671 (+),score=130.05 TRINITY_DN5202_c0_g3_i1:96-2108(+)